MYSIYKVTKGESKYVTCRKHSDEARKFARELNRVNKTSDRKVTYMVYNKNDEVVQV